jgi:hypothetical protein
MLSNRRLKMRLGRAEDESGLNLERRARGVERSLTTFPAGLEKE